MTINDTDGPNYRQEKDPPSPNRFFTTLAARQGGKTAPPHPSAQANQETTLLWAGDSARTTGAILPNNDTSTPLTPGASPPPNRRRKRVSAYAANVGFDFEEDEEGDSGWEDTDDTFEGENSTAPSSLTKILGRTPSSSSLNPTEILSTKELQHLEAQSSLTALERESTRARTAPRPTLVLPLPSLELNLNDQAEDKYDESASFHNDVTTTTPPPTTRQKQEEFILPEDGDFGVEGIIPEGSAEGDANSAHAKKTLITDDADLTDIMSTWGEVSREQNNEEDDWGDQYFSPAVHSTPGSEVTSFPDTNHKTTGSLPMKELIGEDLLDDLFNQPDLHAPPDSRERRPGSLPRAHSPDQIPDSFLAHFELPSVHVEKPALAPRRQEEPKKTETVNHSLPPDGQEARGAKTPPGSLPLPLPSVDLDLGEPASDSFSEVDEDLARLLASSTSFSQDSTDSLTGVMPEELSLLSGTSGQSEEEPEERGDEDTVLLAGDSSTAGPSAPTVINNRHSDTPLDPLSLTSILESGSIDDALSRSLGDVGVLPGLPEEAEWNDASDSLVAAQASLIDLMSSDEDKEEARSALLEEPGEQPGSSETSAENSDDGDSSDISSLLAGAMNSEDDFSSGKKGDWGGGENALDLNSSDDMSAFLEAFDDSDDMTGSAADIIAAPDFLERLFHKESAAFKLLHRIRSLLFDLGRRIDGLIFWTTNWRLYLTMASIAIITICTAIWFGAGLDNTGLEM